VRVVLPANGLLINVGVSGLIGIAPGIKARLRAARCVFPLRFGGQPSAAPASIGVGLVPRDADARLLRPGCAKDNQRPANFLALYPLPACVRPPFLVRVTAAVDKLLVGRIRHLVLIQPEAPADTHLVLWHLVLLRAGVLGRVTAHHETACRY